MRKHAVLVALCGGVLAIGCDDEPQFDCAEMDGRSDIVFCDDFSDGTWSRRCAKARARATS